jgi:hypothetical protein
MRLRALWAVLVVGAGMLVAPPAALAHAVAGQSYEFPIPVWLYASAGGLAVALSVPVAVVGAERDSWVGRRMHPPAWLGAAARAARWLLGACYVVAIVGGLFGPPEFYGNPATVLFWIDTWVGVAVVSALVGNVWDFVSPLNGLGRALDARLARRGVAPRTYPAGLGSWPAVAQLLLFSWLELCWTGGSNPRYIALALLVYAGVHLVGMMLFGAEVWLARAELFTVLARTLGRMAPLELWASTEVPCQAARCDPGEQERLGCPSCYLDADRDRRGVRLRTYAAGVHREPPLPAGGGAFVVAMLATVVFDGFSRTDRWYDLARWLYGRWAWLGAHASTLRLVAMLIIVGGFVALFVAVAALVGRLEGRPAADAARRYAPTLIPIAAVYFVAHYLAYFVVYLQLTPGVALDPFDKWLPDYSIWTSIPGAVVWYVQVVLIVIGHVLAVFEAQRVARGSGLRRGATVLRHAPLTVLMVCYTVGGLWVLAQALAATG